MTGEINFGALEPDAAFTGATHTNALLQQFAKVRAGKALSSGDTQGAVDALNTSGDLEGAQKVVANHWSNAEQLQKLSTAEHTRSAQFAQDLSSALWGHMQQHAQDPDGGKGAVLTAYDQLTPLFKQMGASPQDLVTYRAMLDKDPANTLQYLHQQATEHLTKHTVGDNLVDDHGDVLFTAAPKTDFKTVKRPDQGEDIVRVGGGPPPVVAGQPAAPAATEVAAQPAPPVGAPSGAAGGGTAQPGAPPVTGVDPKQLFNDFVHKAEGGVNPHDLNGAVTNMGFNQAANPDIDVTRLTPEAAAQRFADKYYAPSGAASLPPQLAAMHADTYFINPVRAKEILAASGGDPAKYMQLRQQWLAGVAKNNPDAAKYGPVWDKRNRDLAAYAQGLTQQQPPQTPAPSAPANPNVVYSTPTQQGPMWETRTAKDGDPYFRPGTTYRIHTGPGPDNGRVQKLQDPLTPAQTNAGNKVQVNASDMASVRELRKQSLETANMAQQLDRFVQLNQSVKTGGVKGAIGLTSAMAPFNHDIAEMQGIVNNITPAMRNGLPGSASDKDVAMFRGATVGLDKPLAANQAIAAAAKAFGSTRPSRGERPSPEPTPTWALRSPPRRLRVGTGYITSKRGRSSNAPDGSNWR
jgi:hypothetical protein